MLVDNQAKKLLPKFVGFSDAVAGGSGDNTAVENSAGIDTAGYSSALIVVSGSTTLAEDETLAVTVSTDDSADNSTFADKETLATAVTYATGDTGGSTETGAVAYAIDLDSYERYLKVSFTPNLSASGTDTSDLNCVVILGNSNDLPVTLPTAF